MIFVPTLSALAKRYPLVGKQVIEHSEDPIKFINELTRVAKCGYIEVPSLIGEYLAPKKSHKWAILEIDNKLVFYEKSKILGNYEKDYGEVFLNYLPYQSLPYKLTLITEPKILTIRHEWENNVEVLVNPKDEYFSKYFLSEWNREMAEKIFPRRPFHKELKNTLKGLVGLMRVKM